MMREYSFHGLVGISLEQEHLNLADYYDHYFRMLVHDSALPSVQYSIREYSAFLLPEFCRNVSGIYYGMEDGFSMPQERYAVTFRDGILTEYTDAHNRATNMWLQSLLLERGVSLLHGAGCSLNGKGFLFPAFGGAGKTMLIAALRKNSGFEFYGDDFVAVDGLGMMYAYPSDLSVYEQHIELFPELAGTVYGEYFAERNKRSRLLDEWYRLPGNPLLRQIALRIRGGQDPATLGPAFPPLPEWNMDYVKVPVSEVMPFELIGSRVPISACLMLSRYDGTEFRMQTLAREELVRRVDGILDVEFRYGRIYHHLLAAFGVIDVLQLAQRQYEVIGSAFAHADLYEVLIPYSLSPSEYTSQMFGILSELSL